MTSDVPAVTPVIGRRATRTRGERAARLRHLLGGAWNAADPHAEALAAFGTKLYEDVEPEQVLERTFRFVVEELAPARALLCVRERHGGGLHLRARHRVPVTGPATVTGRTARSALLDRCLDAERPALAGAVRAETDPWLVSLLPSARGLTAIRIDGGREDIWIVFERHQPRHGRGASADAADLTAAAQAAAAASLAMSRAVLLVGAREGAREPEGSTAG